MFTGIIAAKGRIMEIKREGSGKRLVIYMDKEIELEEGDSIAIDGACITVERVRGRKFEVFLSKETLENTKFNKVSKKNYPVNLELSLKPSDKMGGHFVTGHVDSVGRIKGIKKAKGEVKLEVEFDKKFEKYLYPKASIAIDGISFTLQERNNNIGFFTIVPYTYRNTTISLKKKGDLVNIEFDVLAKIVENLIKGGRVK